MKTLAILSQVLLLGLGTFLMIVILLQRGRGGGLAGAFGGLGGQSAFGTKAGDVFTKITIGLAVAWVIVAGGSGYFLRAGAEERASGLGDDVGISAGELPEGEAGEDGEFSPFDVDSATPPPPPGAATQPGAADAEDMDADATTTPAPQTDGGAAATPPAEGTSTPANQDPAPGDAAPGDAASGDGAAATPGSESPATPAPSPEEPPQ